MKPYLEIPILQVRPQLLLVYGRKEWIIAPRKKDKGVQLKNFKDKKAYSGRTTTLNVKRMKRVLNTLVAIARPRQVQNPTTGYWYQFRLNFITLTLPAPQGKVTDKDIKKQVLDVWIKSAKRLFKLKSYFWRAERQKNGNLHFHFCTDTYIPYDKLQDTWNERLNRLGFIDRFAATHGHRHPNSTDVHAVKYVNDLASYLVKYMTKDYVTAKDIQMITQMRFRPGSQAHAKACKRLNEILNLSDVPINGKIWDCSENLKQKHRCEMVLELDAEAIWREERNQRPDKVKDTEHCSFITYTRTEFLQMLRGSLKDKYQEWIESMQHKTAA